MMNVFDSGAIELKRASIYCWLLSMRVNLEWTAFNKWRERLMLIQQNHTKFSQAPSLMEREFVSFF